MVNENEPNNSSNEATEETVFKRLRETLRDNPLMVVLTAVCGVLIVVFTVANGWFEFHENLTSFLDRAVAEPDEEASGERNDQGEPRMKGLVGGLGTENEQMRDAATDPNPDLNDEMSTGSPPEGAEADQESDGDQKGDLASDVDGTRSPIHTCTNVIRLGSGPGTWSKFDVDGSDCVKDRLSSDPNSQADIYHSGGIICPLGDAQVAPINDRSYAACDGASWETYSSIDVTLMSEGKSFCVRTSGRYAAMTVMDQYDEEGSYDDPPKPLVGLISETWTRD